MLNEMERGEYCHGNTVSDSFETFIDGNRNPLSNRDCDSFDVSHILVAIGYRPIRHRRYAPVPETPDQLFHSLYFNCDKDDTIRVAESVSPKLPGTEDPIPGCSFWDDAITQEMWRLRPIFPVYASMKDSIKVQPSTPCVSLTSLSDELVTELPPPISRSSALRHTDAHSIPSDWESSLCEIPAKRSRVSIIESPYFS